MMSQAGPDVFAIALDVGGSSVKSGIVAHGGRMIGRPHETPVASEGPAEPILETFAGVIRREIAALDGADFCGVGLGFSNPMEYPQGISFIKGQFKYDSIYGMHVGAAIRTRVDLGDRPILFRNDAEAAIVGEAVYGAGRPFRRLIGLTLGTGLGSSFVEDGVRQTSGPGVPQEHGGFLWPVPALGARADDVFSTRGIMARLAAAGSAAPSVKAAAEAARRGDPSARTVFAAFGADVGAFLKPYAAAFGAEAVLMLGGIAGALDLFMPEVEAALGVPILPTALGGNAALLGAADLVLPKGS
jgi:glucokinase